MMNICVAVVWQAAATAGRQLFVQVLATAFLARASKTQKNIPLQNHTPWFSSR
jgi:hypothetical protein